MADLSALFVSCVSNQSNILKEVGIGHNGPDAALYTYIPYEYLGLNPSSAFDFQFPANVHLRRKQVVMALAVGSLPPI